MSDPLVHQAGKEMMHHLGHGAAQHGGAMMAGAGMAQGAHMAGAGMAHQGAAMAGAGMVNHGSGIGLGQGVMKGAVMAGVTSFIRHPLVMFALGAAAGIMVYKYRKEIVAYAAQAGDSGRDFVLQQKESLNDLLEEAREEEAEGAASKSGG